MHKLINRNKAEKYFANYYPEIKEEIRFLSLQKNFAGIIQSIINYLFQLLEQSKQCIVIAKIQGMGRLYRRGNHAVKELIENLFIRSFHAMKKRCKPQEWNFLLEKCPAVFQNIYQNQINKDQRLKIKI